MINTFIQLGSITFADETTSGWGFTDLIDWWGQVDDKVPVNERPQAHGAFAVSQSLRSSRSVSFNAVFVGTTQASVENAVDELAAVGAEGPVRMTVTTPAGTSWRTVTVQSTPFTDHRGRRIGKVAIDCVARDPRRYADAGFIRTDPPSAGAGRTWPAVWPLVWPSTGSSGRIVLTNTGRAPSHPVFRMLGGFDTGLITCVETGDRIGMGRQIPPGSTVDIDVANRRAVLDGQADISRWLQFREWGVVPALSSRSYQFDVTGPLGTPFLDGLVYPAWW